MTDYTVEDLKTTAYPSNQKTSSFDTLWQQFLKETHSVFSHFAVDNTNLAVLEAVLAYFAQDHTQCQKAGINLQKGLLLIGPVGCGKTTLMQLFARHRYRLVATRDIARQFLHKGHQVLDSYGAKSFVKKPTGFGMQLLYEQPITYCFDDLGVEESVKHYGNSCNVMAEILLDRYDQFIRYGMMTHLTTNLNTEEIESLYGDRVRSRLRAMFNLISFPREAQDRRR